MEKISQVPTLRDELVPTGTSTLPLMEDLRHEYDSLTQEIGRLQDALDALTRMQRKYVWSFIFHASFAASFVVQYHARIIFIKLDIRGNSFRTARGKRKSHFGEYFIYLSVNFASIFLLNF